MTKAENDRGAFKTPTLRDASRRPPYMHDGSLPTLASVVSFYNRGGEPNQWLSKSMRPLGLSESEQHDLAAFLESLTGEVPPEVTARPTLPE